MTYPKSGQVGYDERKSLLEQTMGVSLPCRKDAFKLAKPAKPDDILDAVVSAWTAKRVVEGKAGRLPVASERNSQGLRVEIVY